MAGGGKGGKGMPRPGVGAIAETNFSLISLQELKFATTSWNECMSLRVVSEGTYVEETHLARVDRLVVRTGEEACRLECLSVSIPFQRTCNIDSPKGG